MVPCSGVDCPTTLPLVAPTWMIRAAPQRADLRAPVKPAELVTETPGKLSPPYAASGSWVTVVPDTSDGASLITSAELRAQVAGPQTLVTLKCWPLLLS